MAKLIIWSGSNPLRIKNAIGTTLWNCGIKYVVKGMTGKIPQMEPGDVVLAMGQKTLDIVQNAGMVAKNRKIGSMRGRELKLHSGKCTIIFTFDPGLIEIDSGRKPDIEWDTKLAIRKAKTGTLEPEIGKYVYVSHFLKEINYINKMYDSTGKKVDICLDLETVGLDPFAEGVFIVSISITVKEGRSSVIRFSSAEDPIQPALIKTDVQVPHNQTVNKDLLLQIEWLVSTDKASMKGANLKFDMNWMNRHWGIHDYSNYRMDTTLVGSLLDENRSNSLNNHAKTYTDMGGYDDRFNEKQDKSRMDLVSSSDLLPYAGGDTDACLRVSFSFRRALSKDKALRNFYVNLLHPASKAVQVMEQRGMVVDVAQYEVLRHKVQAEIDRTSKAFLKSVPVKIKIKYRDNLSPTRASLLNDYLFTKKGLNLKPLLKTAKSGKPSTAMEHMEMLEVEYPKQMKGVIDLLRDYNSATKTMSTYIVGFLKHLRTDGKFHPTYMLHKGDYGDAGDAGTVTGRTSAKDPAYQTIPKHTIWAGPLRTVYVPPQGMVILNIDYSQGELRIMACISNEGNMLNAYHKGIDMHLVTGASVYGIEFSEALAMKKAGNPKIKEIRQGGKAGNFGLIYGISPEGFQVYARKTYGVHLSLEDSKRFKDIFFDQNPNILVYHDDQHKFAHKHGYVRSPLGRIRHLPLINSRDRSVVSKQERQSINSPTQATLSDIGLYAIAELHRIYPELWVNGFTHDSITAYVPDDEVGLWAYRMAEVMENLPLKKVFGWDHQIKFPVDAEVGIHNMGELEEYEIPIHA